MSESGDDDTLEGRLTTVVSGGTLVAAGRVVALALGFALQVVMARFLTRSTYGEVTLVIAIVGLVAAVSKLGLDDGILHQFPKWEDDDAKAYGVVRASFIIALVSGSVFGASLFVLAPYLSSTVFGNSSLDPLFRISAIVVPFLTLTAVAVSFARSVEDARVHTYVNQFINPCARFVLMAALVVSGFRALGAVAGHVIGNILAGLLALFLIRDLIPTPSRETVRMYRPVLLYSLPLVAVEGLNSIVVNIDLYLLGYFLSSGVVGEYNIALQVSNLFYPIHYSFSFLLPPVLARFYKRNERTKMRKLYQIVTKWVVVLALPLLVLFMFLPRMIIGTLFGSEYTGAATALRILAVGNFFKIATGLIDASLIALGKNRIVASIVGFRLFVNTALGVVLVPELGAAGAAVSTAIALISSNTISALVLYRGFGVHPVSQSWLNPIVIMLGITPLAYGVVVTAGLPLFVAVVVVLLVYPLIIIKFAVEPTDETILTLIEDRTNKDLTAIRRLINRLN
jgi:O-antigen/teichoic acid export membrane protein